MLTGYSSIKKGLEEALEYVTYSTNYTGPINLQWYIDRNLVKNGRVTVEYAGGRIDVYGADTKEYGLPPMLLSDFIKLSSWLEGFKTHTYISYDELIKLFEEDCGKIQWAPKKNYYRE